MFKKNEQFRKSILRATCYLLLLILLLGGTVTNAADGLVSSGTSWKLDQYRSLYRYSLPPGKKPSNIVGMGIAGSNDYVYVWYDDGTVSSGTSGQLNRYRLPYPYSLPPGKRPSNIVGMGIAGSNDYVYVWFK